MRRLTQRALALVLALLAAAVSAQVDRPVKILVGFAAGGSADIVARLLAERMQPELKQAVVVDNKPGAGGRIAAEMLKNAPPDGGTIMLAPIVVPVLAPLVFSKLPYDPLVDFAPVAQVANFQFGLSVNAANPIRSVSELITWSKFNASLANYGTPAPGSLPHFFGVQIAKATGIDYVHVPFNGGAPAMNALVGNQVGFVIDNVVDGIEMYRAGRTRMLATSGAARSPLLPEVPTFAEAGLSGIEGVSWFAVYAPAKTPEPLVRQLNAAINKALAAPDLRESFAAQAIDVMPMTTAQFGQYIADEIAHWTAVARASNIEGD